MKPITYTRDEVLGLVKAEVQRLGGQRPMARAVGLSDSFVSDVLAGKRNPCSPRILKYLGISKVVMYVRSGR